MTAKLSAPPLTVESIRHLYVYGDEAMQQYALKIYQLLVIKTNEPSTRDPLPNFSVTIPT